ncbi:hypothetical protein SMICM17S_05439 [Streptomyces microflavus]
MGVLEREPVETLRVGQCPPRQRRPDHEVSRWRTFAGCARPSLSRPSSDAFWVGQDPLSCRDVLALVLLPVPLFSSPPCPPPSPGAVHGGGSVGVESQRAEAQAARDAAAEAFYELDTAQRDLKISIETINAVDNSAAAKRRTSPRWGGGSTTSATPYITAVDAHDLDRDDLEPSVASSARTQLTRAKDDLGTGQGELDRFGQGLGALLGSAETQLARLAPAVERARQALLGSATRSMRYGRRGCAPMSCGQARRPRPGADQAEPGRRKARGRLRRSSGPMRPARGGAAAGAGCRDRPAAGFAADPCAGAHNARRFGGAGPERAAAAFLGRLLAGPPAGAGAGRRQRAPGRGEARGGGEGPGRAALGGCHAPAVHGPCPA